MSQSDIPSITTAGYGEDILDLLARRIIQQHHTELPDLTQVTILLPDRQPITRLRQRLLAHARENGFTALLGPDIDTLEGWITRQPGQPQTILSGHQRELMLVEALISHPYLYGEGNPWMLADSLLELFDELNHIHFQPPTELDDFINQVSQAYGLSASDNESLVGEARLVHTLWMAWHQQMQDAGVSDRHAAQLVQLHNSLQTLDPQHRFYLAGLLDLSPAQARWINQLIAKQQCLMLLQGEPIPASIHHYHSEEVNKKLLERLDVAAQFPPPATDFEDFIARIYSADIDSSPFHERARQAATDYPQSPLSPQLQLLETKNAELEAQAIDIQTRIWWLEGKQSIGIVTENRRLARRVRALLERAGIELSDAAGWALSTTSAAAILERWLQTLEEDFAYQPLLDLLKSPFLLPGQDREHLLATVYRFEQGIIQHENIARDLQRYREHTRYRQNRLPENLAADYEDIYLLLDILQQASAPLLSCLDGQKHSPQLILDALFESLQCLGLDVSLSNDAAGQRVLEELQQMRAATHNSSLRMDWREFRTWLGRTLERFNFQPPNQSGRVQLMSLGQSGLSQFDALIIAGAEQEYLPGSKGNSPFFNDGVRQALGLASRSNELAQRFYRFRQLLGAAPQILITRRSEQDGEDIPASPWLERLQAFHRIAYGEDLIHQTLSRQLGNPETQVTEKSFPLPAPVQANPLSPAVPEMFPDTLSASAYQQLIDCPYQFFASRCLKLSPPESVREMLEKSDYGERVHLCLQAFHSGVQGISSAFPEAITAENKPRAIEFMTDIARRIFAQDLEDNFLHRGWLRRWQESIPGYLDWQIRRQPDWQVMATEQHVEVPLKDSNLKLRGRLDRIDHNAEGLGILDYKTGRTDHVDDILAGESVQLPFYGLLAAQAFNEPVREITYVEVDTTQTKSRGEMSEEDLHNVQMENATRLRNIHTEIQNGAGLTAWGDPTTCQYCQMSGICRRDVWQENSGVR